jgi:hypothetical protein
MVPGAEANVIVRRFEAPHYLTFDWSGGLHVEMRFEPIDGEATRATVAVSGFAGEGMLGRREHHRRVQIVPATSRRCWRPVPRPAWCATRRHHYHPPTMSQPRE